MNGSVRPSVVLNPNQAQLLVSSFDVSSRGGLPRPAAPPSAVEKSRLPFRGEPSGEPTIGWSERHRRAVAACGFSIAQFSTLTRCGGRGRKDGKWRAVGRRNATGNLPSQRGHGLRPRERGRERGPVFRVGPRRPARGVGSALHSQLASGASQPSVLWCYQMRNRSSSPVPSASVRRSLRSFSFLDLNSTLISSIRAGRATAFSRTESA